MGWRVADIRRIGVQMGVEFGKDGRHSIGCTLNDKLAPLPWHDGDKTEVEERDVRRFCRKLGLDADEFLALLRGR